MCHVLPLIDCTEIVQVSRCVNLMLLLMDLETKETQNSSFLEFCISSFQGMQKF